MTLIPDESEQTLPDTVITEEPWGRLADGQGMTRFTLTNAAGACARFMPFGAAVLELQAPDRNGKLADVVLGYATAADYGIDNFPYIGLTVGRYANRIADAAFTIGGEAYRLAGTLTSGPSPRPVALHGGVDGFSNRVWTATIVNTADGCGLRFTLVSPDGDQGFPGEVTASVTYHWTSDFRLIVDYVARTTRPTVINLTQHSYFNLAGAGAGDILDHTLRINADFFTFATPDNLPTGEVLSVRGTPFDFTGSKPVRRDIDADDPHIRQNRGFDQNFVLRRSAIPGALTAAAELRDPGSGRVLGVFTTEPAMFLYTANFLDTGRAMKNGVTYRPHAGVALETGHYPDSPNQPHFPGTTLMPGRTFRSRTVFAFTVS